MTCTDRPARARVTAAASPFGPEPPTIASAVSGASLELKDLALGSHDDIGRSRGDAAGKLIERLVGAARLVVGQHHPSRPGPLAQADRVVGGRVAERGPGRAPLRPAR